MKEEKIQFSLQDYLFMFFISMKVILARALIFGDISLFDSLVTDISLLLALLILVKLYKKREVLNLNIINLCISTIMLIFMVFHSYYGAIVTYKSFGQINQLGSIKDSIISLLSARYLLLYLDILLIFLIRRIKNITFIFRAYVRNSIIYLILIIAVFSYMVNFYMVLNKDYINELINAQKLGFIGYQFYTWQSQRRLNLIDLDSITLDVISEIKNVPRDTAQDFYGIAQDKNILVVQLEAVQSFPIGLKIDGTEVTPIMNALTEESIYFNNFYQQVALGNTSDAEFLLNTSIYPMSNVAMSREFGNRDIYSLPKILSAFGYESVTFHTNDVKFWNRHRMYNALGFARFYDRKFFGDEEIITFGPSDEVLYRKSLPELLKINEEGKKFYANLIAMSSHHPFLIPDSKNEYSVAMKSQFRTSGNHLSRTGNHLSLTH